MSEKQQATPAVRAVAEGLVLGSALAVLLSATSWTRHDPGSTDTSCRARSSPAGDAGGAALVRVARRLHGVVQQRLVLASAELTAVSRALVLVGEDELADRLRRLADDLDHLREHDVRQVAHDLRPGELDLTLRAALVQQLDRLPVSVLGRMSATPEAATILDDARGRMPEETRATLLASVEEAITNAVRHAQASRIELQVDVLPPAAAGGRAVVRLRVRNDGGALRASPPWSGLADLATRVRRAGGTLALDPATAPGGGAVLTVTAPTTVAPAHHG